MLSGRNENGINYYTARKLKDMSQSLEQLAKAFDDGAGETGSLTKDDGLAAMQTCATLVCGSCGGAYTRKTRSPAACAARRASRPRNMWSAARSTGISGCACGITRTNSAMFKGRSARNTPCCGRCSPRRSCCRNKTEMCASPLAIRFSMSYNSGKLCRKGDTPC